MAHAGDKQCKGDITPVLNLVNYDFHDYKGDHMPVLYLVNYDFHFHKGLCFR